MTKEITKYARKCSKCGKGMNEGYLVEGGFEYACSDECFFVDGYTREQFEIDYDDGNGDVFYTEWDEIDEDYHYLADGTEVNTGEIE
jgi:hypothetical protein